MQVAAAPREPSVSSTPAQVVTSPPAASVSVTAAAETFTPDPWPSPSPLVRAAPSPSPSPLPARADASNCEVGDSFTQLVQALGEETVGRCLDYEYVNLVTGDTHQRTTRGLLVWVKVRGVPAFTNGATTWYHCAEAVERRTSNQPFPC